MKKILKKFFKDVVLEMKIFERCLLGEEKLFTSSNRLKMGVLLSERIRLFGLFNFCFSGFAVELLKLLKSS